MVMLTSAKHTLVSIFLSVFAFFRAFLVFRTGTLIIGVFMLELATIRISLSLKIQTQKQVEEKTKRLWLVGLSS